MLRICAVTHDSDLLTDIGLERLDDPDIAWYWVDFNQPTEQEAKLLESHFRFHPLAIEDCYHLLQRPKVDHYETVHFFVLHALNPRTLSAQEVDMFLGSRFLVTFHFGQQPELDEAWQRMQEQPSCQEKGHLYAAYLVMDKLVDEYFPAVYELEDELLGIEAGSRKRSVQQMMDDIFEIRGRLLKLRRTIVPMRDLLYRIVNSERIEGVKEHLFYFTDVYDHLLKLAEMIESNRDMTADMRDSYISMNSNRMNTIMKTLTVITTIFMPLTFIAGIYGMNFDYMPELKWHGGYFFVLGVMFGIGAGMFWWFKRKGWFD
ncbi:magnesium/cobalt transporter CorA [Paenibacillus ehimensis]|uniref:Magnesium transport protein CorA n=1 Tax=Paenibacillus ehimensis TaxID=79264 RepID=A0ABT8V956_9BACL|nr:magnesium/cobalt transporter CorA [Paenibacillus ehimensis]MDO3676566.1 magnesium/cobalt transporter CorA [Paenibacillus ehimensis]